MHLKYSTMSSPKSPMLNAYALHLPEGLGTSPPVVGMTGVILFLPGSIVAIAVIVIEGVAVCVGVADIFGVMLAVDDGVDDEVRVAVLVMDNVTVGVHVVVLVAGIGVTVLDGMCVGWSVIVSGAVGVVELVGAIVGGDGGIGGVGWQPHTRNGMAIKTNITSSTHPSAPPRFSLTLWYMYAP
jgi:hypothetical protein